jgi:hypothetical protein
VKPLLRARAGRVNGRRSLGPTHRLDVRSRQLVAAAAALVSGSGQVRIPEAPTRASGKYGEAPGACRWTAGLTLSEAPADRPKPRIAADGIECRFHVQIALHIRVIVDTALERVERAPRLAQLDP